MFPLLNLGEVSWTSKWHWPFAMFSYLSVPLSVLHPTCLKILFLRYLHTQPGAWTHNPQDQELHALPNELARHTTPWMFQSCLIGYWIGIMTQCPWEDRQKANPEIKIPLVSLLSKKWVHIDTAAMTQNILSWFPPLDNRHSCLLGGLLLSVAFLHQTVPP